MTTTAEVKKMSGIDELSTLLNSRRRMILVRTFEEERFQEDLKALVEEKGYQGYSWSITAGMNDIITGEVTQKIYDPIKLSQFIQGYEQQAVFILKDFHDIWSNYQAKRALRDVLERPDRIYKPIILVSPQASVPIELEKLITVINYDLPTRDQVVEQLVGMEDMLRRKDLAIPEGRERVAIINALVGMTKAEVVNVLKKSVAKHRKIDLNEIVAEKEQIIRKTGLLEYVTKLGNMSDVGGMDVVKEWLDYAQYAFDQDAKELKIDTVKGAVCSGAPGCGKSLLAKSIAHYWNLPLLKMNMSDIMDSRVGQSEKNIDRALKIAEDVSPCVLWLDEMEKALAGLESSGKSDSGTMSRVIQSILTWLSDKEAPVFVIATANNITALPPELTRAGRFDEIFFVSLPHQKEREEILGIHLKKRGYRIDFDASVPDTFSYDQIEELAAKMEEFSGAEIEQVVAESGRRAFAKWKKAERSSHHITVEDLDLQIGQVVPLAKRNPELIRDLREWAKHSAKCASSEEQKLIHSGASTQPKLYAVEGLDDVEFDN